MEGVPTGSGVSREGTEQRSTVGETGIFMFPLQLRAFFNFDVMERLIGVQRGVCR
jgi:hypothetical protein